MGLFGKRERGSWKVKSYDPEKEKPLIIASICNGEQVFGFRELESGDFREVGLVRSDADLKAFRREYGIPDDVVIGKEY